MVREAVETARSPPDWLGRPGGPGLDIMDDT